MVRIVQARKDSSPARQHDLLVAIGVVTLAHAARMTGLVDRGLEDGADIRYRIG
jgi:hypothetical protein